MKKQDIPEITIGLFLREDILADDECFWKDQTTDISPGSDLRSQLSGKRKGPEHKQKG